MLRYSWCSIEEQQQQHVLKALLPHSMLSCRCCVAAAGADDRVTVAKVQVGLLASARKVQQQLERIAARADTNSSEGLHYLVKGEAGAPQ